MSRLPRFQRSSDIAPLRLTGRDQEILKHVRRHRFLRSSHIVALTAGSRQQTLRRLQRLYHHSYLDRPRCQIDPYQSGSQPMVYGLGNKGAAWIKHNLSLSYHQLDWKRKNHIGKIFLEHTLLTAEIMVALELACRQHPDIRLLTTADLNLSKMREPFQWRVNQTAVIPDKIFGLEYRGQRCWYFLEADRATMPVKRRDFTQTSVQRKLLAYEATWKQGIHERILGIHRFRVLMVTTSPERVRKMIEACPQQGRGLFLFTDIAALLAQSDFFVLSWQTVHNDRMTSLLD